LAISFPLPEANDNPGSNRPGTQKPAADPKTSDQKATSKAKLWHAERPVIHAWKNGTAPPVFVIDLDRPPKTRWSEAVEWGAHMLQIAVPRHVDPGDGYFWGNKLMQDVEKRYTFSNEQMAELEGIADQTKLPLSKLISYNLSLTHQFACTSGTARVVESNRLLHFRVLDPAYSLAHLLIEARFMRRNQYVASAITHLGHVAFATGVRPGLSLSVNTNDSSIKWTGIWSFLAILDWALYDPWPIVTRDLLLRETLPSLKDALHELDRGKPNTVYVALSNGEESCAIEQRTAGESAILRSDQGILILGNHHSDHSDELPSMPIRMREAAEADRGRLKHLSEAIHHSMIRNHGQGVALEDMRAWITTSPVKHAGTTLSCIMDPIEGRFIWSAAYESNY
jgi:hypothetical protein